MGTNLRARLSVRNPYWISEHRYYELKHFCLQLPEWRQRLKELDGYSGSSACGQEKRRGNQTADPTAIVAEARVFFSDRIHMIEETANQATDGFFGSELLTAVTEEVSYEKMAARGSVHCGKEVWYAAYRRFFWLLDKKRG